MSYGLFFDWIRKEVRMGYSPFILVVGRQRTGKTALALRMAWEIYKKFDIDKHLFFDIPSFAHAIDKYSQKVLVMDEVGTSLDPVERFNMAQRVYNHIVQSQAYKNNVIFLILPFASEIGKVHRKHVNAIIDVKARGIYRFNKVLQWHSDLSQKPPPVMHIQTIVNMPLPPAHIWDLYKNKYEKQMKQSILSNEIEKLTRPKIETQQLVHLR